MITMEESVNSAWSQVENQYQRRMDLVPNLVNTVKVMRHMRKALTAVVEARAKATNLTVDINDAESLAKYQESQGELSKAMSSSYDDYRELPGFKSESKLFAIASSMRRHRESHFD